MLSPSVAIATNPNPGLRRKKRPACFTSLAISIDDAQAAGLPAVVLHTFDAAENGFRARRNASRLDTPERTKSST